MIDLHFPSATVFNRRIPKQKFYDNLSVNSRLKRIFTEQINTITWQNKISPSTVSVSAGETVTEIEVMLIQLNQRDLDTKVLDIIDREIPYHILFILEYGGEAQIWLGYKEQNQANPRRFKSISYFHTEWLPERALTLNLEGLTMDEVYENLLRQVAGDRLLHSKNESIKESISRTERRAKLEKEIAVLENKIKAEKQFNRQVELYERLGKLRKGMESAN